MTEVRLAQFGMGMADGTIIAWHQPIGAYINKDDPLCDVEAAKATVEITAPCSGILEAILVAENENVPINTVIAIINEKSALAAMTAQPQEHISTLPKVAISPSLVATRTLKRVQVEPRARRAAYVHKIDLAAISGSGPDGRIIEEDVLAFDAARNQSVSAPEAMLTSVRLCYRSCESGNLDGLLAQLRDSMVAPVERIDLILRCCVSALMWRPLHADPFVYRNIAIVDVASDVTTVIEDATRLSVSAMARHRQVASATSRAPDLIVRVSENSRTDFVMPMDTVPVLTLADEDGRFLLLLSTAAEIFAPEPAAAFMDELITLLEHPLAALA